MIDLLKIEIENLDLINHFRESKLLYMFSYNEILSKYDNETINIKSTKQYKGIYFTFEKGRLYIRFKPHYFFNNNLHNANDFSVNNCIKLFYEFIELFNLSNNELLMMKIVNIEYGLNVLSPINGKDLIDFLYLHRKKMFTYKTDLQYYKEKSNSSENIIKAYSKGVQYPMYCNIDTFRFEVKSKKSRHINNLGIFSFLDLLNFDVYLKIRDKILNEFKEVLILHQSVNMDLLTDKDKLSLKDCLNAYNWNEKIKNNHRHTYRNNLNKYNELLTKCGFNIHTILYEILSKKLDELLLNDFENYTLSHPQMYKQKLINKEVSNIENYTFSHIYKGGMCTIARKRICPITGISLDNENTSAKYIQTKTLKYLYQNSYEVYEQIKYNLIRNNISKPKFEQSEIKHLAKQIRNRYYNPRMNYINVLKIAPNQLSLTIQ